MISIGAKKISIVVIIAMIFLNCSCKKDCKIDCSRNSVCINGQCECVSNNMIKVSNLSGGKQSSIFCEDLNVVPPVFVYKSFNSDCLCVKDVYLFFRCTTEPVGGLYAPCRVHILFKDNELDVYRQDEWEIDGFFPSGTGDPQPDLPEVFAEFGAGSGTQLSFCKGLSNIDGITFEGRASSDLDTLYLNVEYLDYANQKVRSTCNMKMLRAGRN
jgi:hypothetical protein